VLSVGFVAAGILLAVAPQLLPDRARTPALAALSLVFVALLWPVPIAWLVAGSLAVYGLGRLLPRVGAPWRTWILGAAIMLLVGVLFVPKLDPMWGLRSSAEVIGLSYLVLKLIQHLVDAAAGRADGIGLPAYVCTLFFLPTFVAGPIERTTDFTRELARPLPGLTDRLLGLERILVGLGKKLLLADALLLWALPAFVQPNDVTPARLVGAIYAYTFGLYLDFAGYSDVAIGFARCAGLRVRENFDNPYLQPNLPQLWAHWHMSLTGWLREFIFVPVTRRVLRRTRRPLLSQTVGTFLTMIAIGLWHGPRLQYAAWGAYHAIGLTIVAVWRSWRGPARSGPLRTIAGTLATFHFFAVGVVLFACDLPTAARIARRLIGLAM
jgi:alginate O-acetyltransferase complex protein AlgI